jgi:hypothetical protein
MAEGRAPAKQQTAAVLVLVTCAFSAGIHFALIPGHTEESMRLGVAFGLAGALLLALALDVYARPRSTATPLVTALLLVCLIAAYLFSRNVGLPGSGHGPEPFDLIGVVTKLAELVALMASIHLYAENRSWHPPLPKTRSTT